MATKTVVRRVTIYVQSYTQIAKNEVFQIQACAVQCLKQYLRLLSGVRHAHAHLCSSSLLCPVSVVSLFCGGLCMFVKEKGKGRTICQDPSKC